MTGRKITIVKANGVREEFESLKLHYSLIKAGAPERVSTDIVHHIEREVEEGMSTDQIYRHAFYLLNKAMRPVALRYSLRRALMAFGPTGFPFEKFIAELFRKKGFTALTDQQVRGHCAVHEVDVVAYNDQKLFMIEAKYHNELGQKSDLKVVLYVKARFDDLKETTFEYGGQKRKLDEGWLITNTKFTSSAIEYAQCQRMKVIGWNYPLENSLVDMITDAGVHPITSLTSLKNSEKQALMARGIVLCNDIVEKRQVLEEIGISQNDISAILSEAKLVCPI